MTMFPSNWIDKQKFFYHTFITVVTIPEKQQYSGAILAVKVYRIELPSSTS